jgi:RNA polymerase sigma-70 factor (ECF subfamily)
MDEFDRLYYASYTSVLRVVVLLTPTVEDAHDVTQEAFARALARWSTVGSLDNPAAWVRKVAVNAATDLHRRDRSRRAAVVRLVGAGRTVPAPDAASVDVARALARLKPGQRKVIVLYYLLDMPVADIAAELGRPVNSVKTDLARGRAALAAVLRDQEETLDV